MLKVLFLCTENACRSQMAEDLVNYDLAGQVKAFSAGVRPSQVNPRAIQVMAELGIDIGLSGVDLDIVAAGRTAGSYGHPRAEGPGPRDHP